VRERRRELAVKSSEKKEKAAGTSSTCQYLNGTFEGTVSYQGGSWRQKGEEELPYATGVGRAFGAPGSINLAIPIKNRKKMEWGGGWAGCQGRQEERTFLNEALSKEKIWSKNRDV